MDNRNRLSSLQLSLKSLVYAEECGKLTSRQWNQTAQDAINLHLHNPTSHLQELLESLVYAEECGKLISPPCWKTGRYCTGRLKVSPQQGVPPPVSPLLQRARAAGLKVYPHTFRNEVQSDLDTGAQLVDPLASFYTQPAAAACVCKACLHTSPKHDGTTCQHPDL